MIGEKRYVGGQYIIILLFLVKILKINFNLYTFNSILTLTFLVKILKTNFNLYNSILTLTFFLI